MLGKKQTVNSAFSTNIRFDRVTFVNKELMDSDWFGSRCKLSNEELLDKYGNNICQQMIVQDREGFYKYSLVVYVDPDDPNLTNIFDKIW